MSLVKIEDKVLDACRMLLPVDSSVVVGVSGGCDSTALLFLLHHHAIQLKIRRLVIAHVNYGLRGSDSDADEALVRSFGEKLGHEVFVRSMEGHSLDEPGMEEWARSERYRFFDEIRREHGCSLIVTGHTLEDQAETVLMRLLRGSGMNGLRGIAPMRGDGVVRPLLNLRKAELAAWLDEKGISYRYDRSNGDTRLLRNRIRHELLPLLEEYNPSAVKHIASVSAEVRDAWNAEQIQVNEWIANNSAMVDENTLWIRRGAVTDAPCVGEALRKLMAQLGSTPDRHHIAMMRAVGDGEEKAVLLPGGWRCAAGRKVLYIEKKRYRMHCEIAIPADEEVCAGIFHLTISEFTKVPDVLDQGRETILCNGDGLDDRLLLRTVTGDDEFIPFGRRHPVWVEKFLAAQGVPLADREHSLILVTPDNKPVWLFGIRLDERFRVDVTTKRVIKVQSSSILI